MFLNEQKKSILRLLYHWKIRTLGLKWIFMILIKKECIRRVILTPICLWKKDARVNGGLTPWGNHCDIRWPFIAVSEISLSEIRDFVKKHPFFWFVNKKNGMQLSWKLAKIFLWNFPVILLSLPKKSTENSLFIFFFFFKIIHTSNFFWSRKYFCQMPQIWLKTDY